MKYFSRLIGRWLLTVSEKLQELGIKLLDYGMGYKPKGGKNEL